MSVYIELVLFNNFMMDAFIVLSTLFLRRKVVRTWRVIFSCILGATCATMYAVEAKWMKIATLVFLAPAMCLFMCKYNKTGKLKDFICTFAAFEAVTFVCGGGVFALSLWLKMDLNSYPVVGLSAGMGCAALIAAFLIRKRKSASGSKKVSAAIVLDEKSISVRALYDSGNLLEDEFSGLPVVILSKSLEKSLAGAQIEGFIEACTVSGKKSLRLVKLNGVEVDGKLIPALGAFCEDDLGDYDVILQCSMA